MKFGQQYPVSRLTLRALRVLVEHPGLTANNFGALCWLNEPLNNPRTLSLLNFLLEKKLLRYRFEPPFWKPGLIVPVRRYYATGLGYTIHQHYVRKRYTDEAWKAHPCH
jgi:hypothetical protein